LARQLKPEGVAADDKTRLSQHPMRVLAAGLGRARAGSLRSARRVDPLGLVGGILGIGAVILIWQLESRSLGAIRLPSPLATYHAMVDNFSTSAVIASQGGGTGGIKAQLIATVLRMVEGVTIGAILGIAVGIAMATVKPLELILRPPLECLRVTPTLVAAPFLILWFGVSAAAQFAVVAVFTFVTIQLNSFTAVRNLPPATLNYGATLGAKRWATMRKVMIPGIMPELIGGLRIIIQIGWGLELVSELIGAQTGIGHMMETAFAIYRTDLVFAGILWISALAVLTDWIMKLILYRMTRWSEGVAQAEGFGLGIGA
jgi:ABC-type nitrate/sulfonate/bicarbonate transport system permease component